MNLTLFAIVTGYLLGSIPTAYLLVRWQSRIDLRTAGSGNVGALNSFEVTRSRMVGLGVLMIDLLKGMAAVAVGRWIGGDASSTGFVAALAAVAGHNFPVWLGGKGGRGLATAAGASLVLGWGLVPLWCLAWALAFAGLRSVNPASTVACVVSPIVVFLLGHLLPGLPTASVPWYPWFVFILMVLILARLVGPTREYLQKLRARRRDT